MDLNTFGTSLLLQLTRLADAAESLAGKAPTSAPTGDAPKTEKAPRQTKTKETAAAKPKHSREEVDKALVTLKDHAGKDEAVAVFKGFGYDKMASIEEKDFDAIYDKAVSRLEEIKAEAEGGEDL